MRKHSKKLEREGAMDWMLTDEEIMSCLREEFGYQAIARAAARKLWGCILDKGYLGIDGMYHIDAEIVQALRQEMVEDK